MTDLQIQYFLKVAQHLSYTAAARELFITQPSLSKQISALERELGTALFDRRRKDRIALTAAGRLFQQTFQRSAQDFQDTLEQVRRGLGDQPLELRAGVAAGWDWGELTAGCARAIQAQRPQARVRWTAHTFRYLRSALGEGELDVIFCPQTGLDKVEGLEVREVAQGEATVYCGAAHPPVRRLEDLWGEPLYVLPPEEAPLSTDINRGYFATRLVLPEVVVLPNRESILLALAGGRGFAVFDDMMAARRDSAYRTLGLGLPIPICGVWKARAGSPVLEDVVQWMAQALGEGRGRGPAPAQSGGDGRAR